MILLLNYYRKVIKNNARDASKMKNAIFDSLYHSVSSNEKPQHQKCPVEEKSWFFYNRRLASSENNQGHNKMKIKLSPDLV